MKQHNPQALYLEEQPPKVVPCLAPKGASHMSNYAVRTEHDPPLSGG